MTTSEELLSRLTTVPKPSRSAPEITGAETQIVQNQKDVRYIVREYPVEVVVQKYLDGREDESNEIYVPEYQRDFVWSERNQSRFIESLLIGIPIPFLFVADVSDEDNPENAGRLEIVDGVQRIRTLTRFLTCELVLNSLERLNHLNGFTFSDLHPSRQRRFRRSTLRLIELTETVGEDVRREMFDRINTGAVVLEAVEVRRGMEPGPFLTMTTALAKDPLLHTLAPISEALAKRFEYEELVTRFFAFLNRYEDYGRGPEGKVVKNFLLSYVRETNTELENPGGDLKEAVMIAEWKRMLAFSTKYLPNGFIKTGRGRKVPRVRFEALAVGIGLALRDDEHIVPKGINKWINSEDFKSWTTSDAANNRSNLIGRIEYVRDRICNL